MFSRAINSYLSWKYPIVRSPKIVKRLKPQVMASIIDPTEEKWEVVGWRFVTAYNAVEEQTDSEPCISASGLNVCETDKVICASNEFEFGTILKIGERICEVFDKTNARYKHLVDILMDSKQEALNFGKQILLIEKKL